MTDEAEVFENIRGIFHRDLQKEARAFQKLKGGRNSRVFRVECGDGCVFAVKAYFQSEHDRRDRMGCEFRALQLLQSEGLRETATPVAADASHGIAVYEFVEGESPNSATIGPAEIDQALGFLHALRAIARSGRAAHFPAASEACFSIQAIWQSVDGRFQRFDKASENEPALADFLHNEVEPLRIAAGRWCRDFCRENDIAADVEIPIIERTLSPSDFGFHNALKCADGRLVFLDFEYFGWDDPAKTVVDFLLHPGMELPHALRQRFYAGMIAAFADVPKLRHRVRAVYPLFGLKWCAILLNEFTLEHMARRRFADGTEGAWDGTSQIEKARCTLAIITNALRDFPYHP